MASNSKTSTTSHTTISSTIRRRDRSEIDTTGRRSIFQVRGASYPPRRRARFSKQNSQIATNEDEVFEEDIQILESHIDIIEDKVNVLTLTKSTIIQNASEQLSDKPDTKERKFSELSIDELLKLTGLLDNSHTEQNTNTNTTELQPGQFD
ncbi:3609_t:CDS:1, partial [Ambispora gerdemannii]